MEEKHLKGDSDSRRENDERKQPYTHREIKRKLSLIKKKVDDLQHQRKIAYKNSVKVKRAVHNQINQIVKCLRSRERYLWSEIDDAYLSQDENITQELLRLQSIFSNYQTLFAQLENNPQNAKALSKICCNLVQVNYEEKFGKALEFTSEFETLKTLAADFGNLIGDFTKKDEFVLIDKDGSSSITSEKIHNNREYFKRTVSEKNIGKEDSNNENLSTKTDLEDLFEEINFNDNVSCGELEKDFHMVDPDDFENGYQKIENLSLSNRNGNKLKDSNKIENSNNALKNNDFNAEEEWRQLFELKNRVSSICSMLPKLENEGFSPGNQNATTSNNSNAVKSSNEFVYLSPNEVNDWLPRKRARRDSFLNKCNWQSKYLFGNRGGLLKMNSELEKNKIAKSYDQSQINLRCELSPAEIVLKEFSKYSVKDGIENWLSRY